MKGNVAELIATLSENSAVLKELQALLQKEQSCLASLDLESLEENQQRIVEAMERMGQLAERSQALMASVGNELGIPGNKTLSPIISRLPQREQGALREVQASVSSESRALNRALTLNRGLLEDSLNVVQRSVTFFNRLFNPGDTYGVAGSLVSRRGGSRFVCKEV